MATWDSTNPYDRRRRWRRRLPWFLINLGVAAKGEDCEAVGAKHLWYNFDNEYSRCYYCEVERPGRLWETNPD